jgi:hypothetical protein
MLDSIVTSDYIPLRPKTDPALDEKGTARPNISQGLWQPDQMNAADILRQQGPHLYPYCARAASINGIYCTSSRSWASSQSSWVSRGHRWSPGSNLSILPIYHSCRPFLVYSFPITPVTYPSLLSLSTPLSCFLAFNQHFVRSFNLFKTSFKADIEEQTLAQWRFLR